MTAKTSPRISLRDAPLDVALLRRTTDAATQVDVRRSQAGAPLNAHEPRPRSRYSQPAAFQVAASRTWRPSTTSGPRRPLAAWGLVPGTGDPRVRAGREGGPLVRRPGSGVAGGPHLRAHRGSREVRGGDGRGAGRVPQRPHVTAAACRRVEAQSASSSPPACFWTVDMAMALPRALTSTVTSRALVSV